MLERGKDETHTFRQVDMCKWQMDDPETQMKFSLSDCTWLEDFAPKGKKEQMGKGKKDLT